VALTHRSSNPDAYLKDPFGSRMDTPGSLNGLRGGQEPTIGFDEVRLAERVSPAPSEEMGCEFPAVIRSAVSKSLEMLLESIRIWNDWLVDVVRLAERVSSAPAGEAGCERPSVNRAALSKLVECWSNQSASGTTAAGP
jgi:hypothetical protein